MKILVGIFALLLVGFSVFADYKWKRWMAARKETNSRDESFRDNQF